MTPNNQSPGKKDVSMETRLLLAFLLTGLLLFLTQYFYKPAPPAPNTAQTTQTTGTPAAKSPAVENKAESKVETKAGTKAASTAAAAEPTLPVPGAIHAAKEEIFTVDTALYRIVLSNKGAVVKSWILKNYKDDKGKPVELVNQAALSKTVAPFSILLQDDQPDTVLNDALFVATPASGGLGIDYEFSDGHTACKKSFRFQQDGYLSQVSSEVSNNGAPVPHMVAWRGGFGDPTVTSPESVEHALYFDLAKNKLNVNTSKTAKKGPVSAEGTYSFAGLEDSFFTAVFLPKGTGSFEITTFSDSVPTLLNPKDQALVGAGIGGQGDNRFSLYVGPKDIDILRKVDPKLEQVVDWGWFGMLAKPLFVMLNWTSDHIVHNYGWSIVLVTVVLSMLLLPLKFSSLKSARKMQELQPQIAAINEKYKNIGLRDPRKAEQNQEIMELYKKHGANPLGGCVPMAIQLPFFYAFYKVLTVAIEMRGAHWLWISDISRVEDLPIRMLPVILIVTQFFAQKLTPTTSMDPTQQKMMLIMPLGLGFVFYSLPAGLVLYYLTSNLVSIGQQLLTNKIMGVPAPPPKPAAPAKRKISRN
ncbi:MAG TPA: membrane protein insertase YidC [Bryobacteraceae bacterium]|nr:membrane protein insertase YidC [Bryobacteraceae bacterium]